MGRRTGASTTCTVAASACLGRGILALCMHAAPLPVQLEPEGVAVLEAPGRQDAHGRQKAPANEQQPDVRLQAGKLEAWLGSALTLASPGPATCIPSQLQVWSYLAQVLPGAHRRNGGAETVMPSQSLNGSKPQTQNWAGLQPVLLLALAAHNTRAAQLQDMDGTCLPAFQLILAISTASLHLPQPVERHSWRTPHSPLAPH